MIALYRSPRFMGNAIARNLSSEAAITAEEISTSEAKVEKYRKYHQVSASAKTFTDNFGAEKALTATSSDVTALSGMPADQQARTVFIAPLFKNPMQSGARAAHQWTLTWKVHERWNNPLMGWTSTADPMSSVKLTFDSSEEAVNYAEKNGWKFEVTKPLPTGVVEPGTHTYADNFLPKKTQAQIREDGAKNKIWENPGYGKSNWYMPLTFHGDREVEQFGPPVKK